MRSLQATLPLPLPDRQLLELSPAAAEARYPVGILLSHASFLYLLLYVMEIFLLISRHINHVVVDGDVNFLNISSDGRYNIYKPDYGNNVPRQQYLECNLD
jgi:hypothetical protein